MPIPFLIHTIFLNIHILGNISASGLENTIIISDIHAIFHRRLYVFGSKITLNHSIDNQAIIRFIFFIVYLFIKYYNSIFINLNSILKKTEYNIIYKQYFLFLILIRFEIISHYKSQRGTNNRSYKRKHRIELQK